MVLSGLIVISTLVLAILIIRPPFIWHKEKADIHNILKNVHWNRIYSHQTDNLTYFTLESQDKSYELVLRIQKDWIWLKSYNYDLYFRGFTHIARHKVAFNFSNLVSCGYLNPLNLVFNSKIKIKSVQKIEKTESATVAA